MEIRNINIGLLGEDVLGGLTLVAWEPITRWILTSLSDGERPVILSRHTPEIQCTLSRVGKAAAGRPHQLARLGLHSAPSVWKFV